LFEQISRGVLLPACILNNFAVKLLLDVLFDFKDSEKMLIKRVSSFQVVQMMGCISNKCRTDK